MAFLYVQVCCAEDVHMTGLVRAAVKAPSGVVRIFVLCPGCLPELVRLQQRRWVKPFEGDGECELCQRELQKMAQSD